ncbi:hypothetical protein O181_037939 [Austropuccinia psidii MF-1]|uniref:Uncharacterized protein n=1 Tax=Austropuccinia psidii MF-1 TaxID=1389203 RepID=A0A9Q3D7I2_9BASI|nr:hypothetical protein [Austropuccinia psidii MF-1]
MKQIQDILLTQNKEKGKRRGSTSYTPGGSPSEPTLPSHVRPEESPSSPTPGPRATSTPSTEARAQYIPRSVFVSTHTHPSPLQKEITRVEKPVAKIRAKDYNVIFYENEVEKIIKRVDAAAEIEGASGEYIARQFIFISASEGVKEKIESMQGYEDNHWEKPKEEPITEWGRV